MTKVISITKKNGKIIHKGYCNFQEWYEALEFVNSVEKKLTGKVLSPRSDLRSFSNGDGGTQVYRLEKIGGLA